MSWVTDLNANIYTLIKYRLEKEYKAKYPDLYITSSSISPDVARSPTVYIFPLSWAESGRTFEGSSIKGLICGIQAEVTVKEKDVTLANAVMGSIEKILCNERGWEAKPQPYENSPDLYRLIWRFSTILTDERVL